VSIRFSGLSETGAALLGGLITLTPGTTTVHVDMARGEMLLHMLDLSHPTRAARDIRRRFEVPLRRLFPGEVRP
jgi:multisubunit Na+/H+ antiporter MnhE subunit